MIGFIVNMITGKTSDQRRADDKARGQQFARNHIEKHGKENVEEMDNLWVWVEGPDRTEFDRGLSDELRAQNIPHPMDRGL